MGVKKTMDTFFASMQEQSMSGYSGRLVNTPMGPFRWNDTMQLWENVNNGMVMNNISFQDSIMMLDYSSTDGGFDIRNIPVVPGGDPNLVLYLNFTASAIGPVTYSRGGTASFVDSSGDVTFALSNVPRFSYYPTGTTVGLLIENTSTNIIPRGECFALNLSWEARIPGRVAIDQDEKYGLAPDGKSLPTLIMPRGNTEGILFGIQTNDDSAFIISGPTGVTYAFSVWVKGYAESGTSFSQNVAIGLDNTNYFLTYNLPNNSLGATFGTPYGRITNYSNNWKRIELTGILQNSPANIIIAPTDSSTNAFPTEYASDSNNNGILVWGAQLEQNTSASSYIRTTGATATRGNDLAYLAGTGFTWFNGSCGTFVFEFDKKTVGHTADNIKNRTIMSTNYYNSSLSAFAIDYNGGNTLTIKSHPDTLNNLFYLSPLTSGMNKVAFNYINDGSDFTITASLNGGSTASFTDSNTSINFNGCTFMTLGYKQALVGTTAYDYLDTTIRSVQYWNKALSGASLQQLSI